MDTEEMIKKIIEEISPTNCAETVIISDEEFSKSCNPDFINDENPTSLTEFRDHNNKTVLRIIKSPNCCGSSDESIRILFLLNKAPENVSFAGAPELITTNILERFKKAKKREAWLINSDKLNNSLVRNLFLHVINVQREFFHRHFAAWTMATGRGCYNNEIYTSGDNTAFIPDHHFDEDYHTPTGQEQKCLYELIKNKIKWVSLIPSSCCPPEGFTGKVVPPHPRSSTRGSEKFWWPHSFLYGDYLKDFNKLDCNKLDCNKPDCYKPYPLHEYDYKKDEWVKKGTTI